MPALADVPILALVPAIPPTTLAEALSAGATDVARMPVPSALLAARCRNLCRLNKPRRGRVRRADEDQRGAHRRRRRRRGAGPGARDHRERARLRSRVAGRAHRGLGSRVRDRRERCRADAAIHARDRRVPRGRRGDAHAARRC